MMFTIPPPPVGSSCYQELLYFSEFQSLLQSAKQQKKVRAPWQGPHKMIWSHCLTCSCSYSMHFSLGMESGPLHREQKAAACNLGVLKAGWYTPVARHVAFSVAPRMKQAGKMYSLIHAVEELVTSLCSQGEVKMQHVLGLSSTWEQCFVSSLLVCEWRLLGVCGTQPCFWQGAENCEWLSLMELTFTLDFPQVEQFHWAEHFLTAHTEA